MKAFVAVFLGGGLGSITRYGISLLVRAKFDHVFPLATLISNIISTAILAILLFSVLKTSLPQSVALMLTVGFCGGFSTFSTFSMETFQLMKSGQYWFAVFNIIVSIVLALAVLFILSKSF